MNMTNDTMNMAFIDICKRMAPISLSEMDEISLMNRIDTKYLMPIEYLPDLLKHLEKGFRIQEVENKKISKYSTIYFDTPDLKMYLMHHNNRMTRQKIRTRTYLDSGISFLEIKNKNNKGRTSKLRISIPNNDFTDFSGNAKAVSFLKSKSIVPVEELYPKISSSFDRITLVNNDKSERITIDTHINFYNFGTGIKANVPGLVIIELKQDGRIPSILKDSLAEFRIRPGGMSKYCLGTVLTDPEAKSNSFRQKLRYINKLTSNCNESN
jgi:hypothetical protein